MDVKLGIETQPIGLISQAASPGQDLENRPKVFDSTPAGRKGAQHSPKMPVVKGGVWTNIEASTM